MRNLLFTLALLVSFSSFGQNNKDALRLCSVLQSNSFSSNSAAEDALERILGTIGASKRFVLQPCSNTNNAVATSYKGIRYILYDPEFMNSLNYGSNWGNLFILAHEVGHHINGHSLDLVLYAADAVESVSLSQSRIQELEADEFAGFVLAKLGGPISAANQVISKISNNSDDSYNTHPSRNKRLNAAAKGYKSANKNSFVKKDNLSEEYFYKAVDAYNNFDYPKATENINVAIALKGDNDNYHSLKGDICAHNSEFLTAIESYKKAIDINPNIYWNYSAIGYMYLFLNERSQEDNLYYVEQSESYFLKSIEINSADNATDYYQLGKLYFEQKKLTEAINYLTQSIKIEPTDNAYFFRGLSNGFNKNNYDAIADFTSAINITDDIVRKADYFYFRAIGKNQLGDLSGYCNDLNEANILDPQDKHIDKEYCN